MDVLLLMMVYLGSRVKSYASDVKYVRMVVMLVLSTAIGISSSFFVAFANLTNWHDAFWSSIIPLLGFLTYDVIYSSVGASLDRRARVTWLDDFIRHLKFSIPLLIVAACVNFILAYMLVLNFQNSAYQAFILIFLIDYVLISTYWALKSVQHASKRENRIIGESVNERFRRSSATNVSLNVAIVVASALVFVIFNGGLKAAGVGFSQLCQ